MEIYKLPSLNSDNTNSNVNWKKMYTIMLTAADDAISKIEHRNFAEAAAILQKAMLECEDEYIGSE